VRSTSVLPVVADPWSNATVVVRGMSSDVGGRSKCGRGSRGKVRVGGGVRARVGEERAVGDILACVVVMPGRGPGGVLGFWESLGKCGTREE